MARSLRDLRRKMKAIKSTRQVTKAMELVAASKMRRAVQNAQMLRHYALMAWHILQKVSGGGESHPYMTQRPVKKVLVVLFTSDRGLCGSLNAQVFRTLTRYIQGLKDLPTFEKLDFIAAGRKGQQFLRRMDQSVIAAFPAFSNHPRFRDVLPVTRIFSEAYMQGAYDHVVLIYADFISPLVQEPTVKVLLPFSKTDLRDMLGSILPKRSGRADADIPEDASGQRRYLFEPSPEAVLSSVLPQLTEMQVYQAALETSASEHSARMVAMRSATDNASDLLDDLTLTYNQTRQASITAELAELSASKAALE